jgi:ribose transport system ATP-binding protein
MEQGIRENGSDQDPLLQCVGLTKSYGAVKALDAVDFSLFSGEVHVLFGENGAGKSTLISILAGATLPTLGEVFLGGEKVEIRSVRHARELGISAVFQEFSLVPTLTVAENLLLGAEPRRGPFLNLAAGRQKSNSLFRALEIDMDPNLRVAQLSRAEQQMVEIAKALRDKMRVLILDEPTASLTDRETDHLFELIKRLTADGIGIIYISHRIHEFEKIADRITVLRDGRLSGTVPAKTTTEAALLLLMAGRDVGEIYPEIISQTGDILMEARELSADGIDNVSFTIRGGEVSGFAGLVGSGKSEVWRAIMGLSRKSSGTIQINNSDCTMKSTHQMMLRGVYYLPPDRKNEGLVLSATSSDNILLGIFSGPSGMLRGRTASRAVSSIAKRVGLNNRYISLSVSQLSGGNQQKVLFGKAFGRDYDIYVFDEPSVGVDMGTRAQLYRIIQSLSDAGKAVVVISSDLREVLNLSHRLFVFAAGRIKAELCGSGINEQTVLGHFFEGQKKA